MKYVITDPTKLGSIGQQLLLKLRVFQAGQAVVDKGRPPNLPTYTLRSIVTDKMRAKMRKARKAQKASRRRNRFA